MLGKPQFSLLTAALYKSGEAIFSTSNARIWRFIASRIQRTFSLKNKSLKILKDF